MTVETETVAELAAKADEAWERWWTDDDAGDDAFEAWEELVRQWAVRKVQEEAGDGNG